MFARGKDIFAEMRGARHKRSAACKRSEQRKSAKKEIDLTFRFLVGLLIKPRAIFLTLHVSSQMVDASREIV